MLWKEIYAKCVHISKIIKFPTNLSNHLEICNIYEELFHLIPTIYMRKCIGSAAEGEIFFLSQSIAFFRKTFYSFSLGTEKKFSERAAAESLSSLWKYKPDTKDPKFVQEVDNLPY